MVYIRKNRKIRAFRALLICFAVIFLFSAVVGAVNRRLEGFIVPLARTGITREITRLINEAAAEALSASEYGELAVAVYDGEGRVRSVKVESLRLGALRADVSLRVAEKLDALDKFYVDVDISNIMDDEVLFGKAPISFTVDVIPSGGVETDVKSEFVSAGINQTNYRLSLTVKASVTADVISSFTVEVLTGINIVDMLIVGDVPTVVWG